MKKKTTCIVCLFSWIFGFCYSKCFWGGTFLWAIFFVGIVPIYKMFRKMIYKHRKKKPEYYEAKEIVIKNISEFSSKKEK